MKNLPKTETPEVLCFSSMGNGTRTKNREQRANTSSARNAPQRDRHRKGSKLQTPAS